MLDWFTKNELKGLFLIVVVVMLAMYLFDCWTRRK